jgi:DNA-binding transcriptional LysR family regulator
MIDVRKLRMLTELDRLGTVTAVAAALHLTAPGISMQLAALERKLGITLTEKQGRRLALTPAGKLLAEHGRELMDRISLAELEVDALKRGAAGHIRIAAFPSAAGTFVADAWREILDDGAAITLSLTTPEPEAALAALAVGEVDLGVVHSYSNVARSLPDGIEAEPLVTEPIWLAIRVDDPAAADTVDIAALADQPWIAPEQGLTCYEMIDRACGLAGFRPHLAAQSMDFAAQLKLVAAGAGVALIPDLAARSVPDGVRLAAPAQPLRRHTMAVRRTARHADPGLGRITTLLRSCAQRAVRRAPAPAGQ